jgi:uncharacterized protein (TIGR03083 family)
MRPAVLSAFLEGVGAIESISAELADQDWARPTPCPQWTASDLIGHVRCAAEDYNAVLDAALDGRSDPVLRGTDLSEHNSIRLAALAPASPLVHVACFGLDARRFAARAARAWRTALFELGGGYYWSIGDYIGYCALEWHVHAWDLANAAGIRYGPRCVPALACWWREKLPHLPLRADCAWEELLLASGRAPDEPSPGRRPARSGAVHEVRPL